MLHQGDSNLETKGFCRSCVLTPPQRLIPRAGPGAPTAPVAKAWLS